CSFGPTGARPSATGNVSNTLPLFTSCRRRLLFKTTTRSAKTGFGGGCGAAGGGLGGGPNRGGGTPGKVSQAGGSASRAKAQKNHIARKVRLRIGASLLKRFGGIAWQSAGRRGSGRRHAPSAHSGSAASRPGARASRGCIARARRKRDARSYAPASRQDNRDRQWQGAARRLPA